MGHFIILIFVFGGVRDRFDMIFKKSKEIFEIQTLLLDLRKCFLQLEVFLEKVNIMWLALIFFFFFEIVSSFLK